MVQQDFKFEYRVVAAGSGDETLCYVTHIKTASGGNVGSKIWITLLSVSVLNSGITELHSIQHISGQICTSVCRCHLRNYSVDFDEVTQFLCGLHDVNFGDMRNAYKILVGEPERRSHTISMRNGKITLEWLLQGEV